MPMNMKNNETIRRANFASFNADGIQKGDVLGGRRRLMVRHANAMMGIMRKPIIRTDHPNPKEEPFSILDNAMGITMPPTDAPAAAMPRAAARFLSNHCDTAGNAGN